MLDIPRTPALLTRTRPAHPSAGYPVSVRDGLAHRAASRWSDRAASASRAWTWTARSSRCSGCPDARPHQRRATAGLYSLIGSAINLGLNPEDWTNEAVRRAIANPGAVWLPTDHLAILRERGEAPVVVRRGASGLVMRTAAPSTPATDTDTTPGERATT